MRKLFLMSCLFSICFSGFSQVFPVEGKKDLILFKGSKRDTSRIEYDLKPKVREWLKTTMQDKSKGFSFVPEKNMFTGTVFTTLKYTDSKGKEKRYPLYFTMNIHIVESTLLKESTYKYELLDFDIMGSNKKHFPAERLLLKGENEEKETIPAENLQEIKTQAMEFIDSTLASLHKSMLSGLVAE